MFIFVSDQQRIEKTSHSRIIQNEIILIFVVLFYFFLTLNYKNIAHIFANNHENAPAR
jgi:hypothetical protein